MSEPCSCDLARSEPLDHKPAPRHLAACPRWRAGCKNCGEPVVWVPDRGGRWTHYRADSSCGRPEPAGPPVQRWETTLSDEGGDLG